MRKDEMMRALSTLNDEQSQAWLWHPTKKIPKRLQARSGLMQAFSGLKEDHRLLLFREGCGFGNKPFIQELEEVGQPYLS